ncbi:MAG: RNA polymerase subunit sigma-24, partial [Clostridia bacterium]|nr:RNA polymerase subunit sigma-24 [Clostridia bacterium]
MKQNKILKDYIENNELNIEQIINDYSGYVYTIIKNISNQKFTQEDIEE